MCTELYPPTNWLLQYRDAEQGVVSPVMGEKDQLQDVPGDKTVALDFFFF